MKGEGEEEAGGAGRGGEGGGRPSKDRAEQEEYGEEKGHGVEEVSGCFAVWPLLSPIFVLAIFPYEGPKGFHYNPFTIADVRLSNSKYVFFKNVDAVRKGQHHDKLQKDGTIPYPRL